jgi:hypothetical protein
MVGLVMRRTMLPRKGACVAVQGLALGATLMVAMSSAAAAAEAHFFPVSPHLVPAVVAAVFVLPAAIGCLASGARRAGRAIGPVLGMGLIVAAIAVITAYVDPSLLKVLRG